MEILVLVFATLLGVAIATNKFESDFENESEFENEK